MLLERLDATGELPETYPCYVQVIRFGDALLLAALGWEVVVDYALRLKQEVDDTEVWVAGYSNEIFNYLPSARVLAERGVRGRRILVALHAGACTIGALAREPGGRNGSCAGVKDGGGRDAKTGDATGSIAGHHSAPK